MGQREVRNWQHVNMQFDIYWARTGYSVLLQYQIVSNVWTGPHSSVHSSAPTILPPLVRVPSTPSLLLTFKVFLLYLPCEKNKNKQKEAWFGPFFKKSIWTVQLFNFRLASILIKSVITLTAWLWKSETMIWSNELMATNCGPASLATSLPRDPNFWTSLPPGWKTKMADCLLSTTTTWPDRSTAMPLGPAKKLT